MNKTGYLSIEICRECNLGAFHKRCPNLHPDRYASVKHDEPLRTGQRANVAIAMYRKHGFRGRVGFHYYNEPLADADRMWELMDTIGGTAPEAEFVLWSNGTLLPEDCEPFKQFAEIHITDYQIPEHRAVNLSALKKACPYTMVHRWGLDDRINVLGDEVRYSPCHRMFTEFIVDCYGNVHLCCYDWRGLASIGNVQETPLGELVKRWQEVREQIGGGAMDPNSPDACLKCKMRSSGITSFVEEPAKAARQMVRRWR
jgi:hypothetical protein